MLSVIQAARVITPDEELMPGSVLIEDGSIAAVGCEMAAPADARLIDAREFTLAPGFVDIHVHGGGGFSLATTDPEEIKAYARWVVRHGVTSFLASICAGDLEQALAYTRAASRTRGDEEGAHLLGLHLEGPFVNYNRRGALPAEWIMRPDRRTFDGLAEAASGHLRVMTLAPEVPGAGQLIRTARERGVTVAVGHTDATSEVACHAFEAGASHVTHAFNAMRPFHHREPGPVGAAITSPGVTVEAIADGVHLHPATLAMLVRSLGPERVALVTDGVTPAGLTAGAFRLGEHEAHLREGRVLLPDGTIAGSAETMDGVLRNIVEWGVADLRSTLRMASAVPAGSCGVGDRKGRLAPGYDADLVAVDDDLKIAMTVVSGRVVYLRESSRAQVG